MGMQGLMEAGKNPELLAQLFQDMQVSYNIPQVRVRGSLARRVLPEMVASSWLCAEPRNDGCRQGDDG